MAAGSGGFSFETPMKNGDLIWFEMDKLGMQLDSTMTHGCLSGISTIDKELRQHMGNTHKNCNFDRASGGFCKQERNM
jgi:hypothetical protein